MATKYSNQYQGAFVNKPMDMVAPGDISGDVKFAYFDITIAATGDLNDVFKLFRLPKGAKLKSFNLVTPDLGTAGAVQVGWAASEEKTAGTTTAVVAADAAGILGTTDVNTAAVNSAMVFTSNGFLKHFDAAVDVEMKVQTAWTVTSGTIKGWAEYVLV